ncbi:MAG: hypothetical protein IJO56_02605 [Oscillospiraceae bacterium]|nr:hypothetical protein [Oscillospiraceae bacterium]
MKKAFCLISATLLLLLCACNSQPAQTQDGTTVTTASAAPDCTAGAEDVAALEKLYEGRVAYHGDMHAHTNSGGNSDGNVAIEEWPELMEKVSLDFAAIVDHCQTLHMRAPSWDDKLYIVGSESGGWVHSVKEGQSNQKFHANYLFTDLEGMENFLNEYPLFFAYFQETGLFKSNGNGIAFTREDMAKIAASVRENGGLLVFNHPKLADNGPTSEELMDFWWADETGFETLYGYADKYYAAGMEAYKVWVQLLDAGKRIWATAGSDTHRNPRTTALTTVYSTEQSGKVYMSYIREGDFNPGPMGIRMAIGDTLMGGKGSFEGQKVIFSVGDFHEVALENGDQFRAVLLDDTGEVFSQVFTAGETVFFSTEAQADKRFYRVEIYNVATDTLVGIGNPIWNEQ